MPRTQQIVNISPDEGFTERLARYMAQSRVRHPEAVTPIVGRGGGFEYAYAEAQTVDIVSAPAPTHPVNWARWETTTVDNPDLELSVGDDWSSGELDHWDSYEQTAGFNISLEIEGNDLPEELLERIFKTICLDLEAYKIEKEAS